jgi:hypothetical protein
MDGALVCAASTTEYKMWQVKTGYLQDLFPFDGEQMTPIITKISKVGPNTVFYCFKTLMQIFKQ